MLFKFTNIHVVRYSAIYATLSYSVQIMLVMGLLVFLQLVDYDIVFNNCEIDQDE